MSFAASKNSTKRVKSPGGSPHKPERTLTNSRYGVESPASASNLRASRVMTASADMDMGQKLEVLEGNLTRVSQQQDALLPLMNMIDLAPSVQKNEGILKNLHKKQNEADEKVLKLEQMFRNYQTNVDSTLLKLSGRPVSNFDAGLFEKNLKSIGNQVTDQQTQFKELEHKFTTLEEAVGERLQDELGMLYRNVEAKLDKHRQETITALGELKNGTNNNLKRFDEVLKDIMSKSEKFADFMQYNDRQKILEDINQLITLKNQEQLEYFKDKYDRDIENLYREFGIIRSEMDLVNEEKKQHKMASYLSNLPKDVVPAEKKIKINNIEQALNIHDLEKFNKENTQRIMYELQAFDEKLDSLKVIIANTKSKLKNSHDPKILNSPEILRLRDDMEVINERYLNLKYQIEGAKKKYLFDMRKIEDKMERIEQIRKEASDELEANPKTKRIIPQELKVIDEFPEKLKGLMEAINKNLETTFTRLEIVEEKIKDNQEALRK